MNCNILVLSSNNYGGYDSKETQEKAQDKQALADAIAESRARYPQYFPTLKETIIKNADPDKGFLTPSGTYVKIYSNPNNQERVYVPTGQKVTVPPAGKEISPTSAEGKQIQAIYARQAEDRLANMVQQERFWNITSGNASVRDVLLPNQTPQQRELTETFFSEREISLDTPLNQLSLSPKKYTEAREALRSGDAGDLEQYVSNDIYYKDNNISSPTYGESLRKDQVKYVDPLLSFDMAFAKKQGELLAPQPQPAPRADGYYDIDVDPNSEWNLNRNFKENPITPQERADILEMVNSAKTEGYDYITFSQERTVNGKIVTSVKTVSLENTDNVESEFVRIFQFGKPDDKLEVITHKGKEPPMQPDPVVPKETSTKIPSTASYAVVGAVLAPDVTKNFLDDITKALGLEQKQSYEEWQDYRNNPITGIYTPQVNLGKTGVAVGQGGSLEDIQKRLENTEMGDTALDSVMRMFMAGVTPKNEGEGFIANDVQDLLDVNSKNFDPIKGLSLISGRIEEQRKVELQDWQKYSGYYVSSLISDVGQMAILIPQGRIDLIGARLGTIVARATLALKPNALTTAGKLASGVATTVNVGGKIGSNVLLGGTSKSKATRFTIEQVLGSTDVERKAYPALGQAYKILEQQPNLQQLSNVTPKEYALQVGLKSESIKIDDPNRLLDIYTVEAKNRSGFERPPVEPTLIEMQPAKSPKTVIEITGMTKNRTDFIIRRDEAELSGNMIKIQKGKKPTEYKVTTTMNTMLTSPYGRKFLIGEDSYATKVTGAGLADMQPDFAREKVNLLEILPTGGTSIKIGKSTETKVLDSIFKRLGVYKTEEQIRKEIPDINAKKELWEDFENKIAEIVTDENKEKFRKLKRPQTEDEKLTYTQNLIEYTSTNEIQIIKEYKFNKIRLDDLENQLAQAQGRKFTFRFEFKKQLKEKKNDVANIQEEIDKLKKKIESDTPAYKQAIMSEYEKELYRSYIEPIKTESTPLKDKTFTDEGMIESFLTYKNIDYTNKNKLEFAKYLADIRKKPLSAEDFYNIRDVGESKKFKELLAKNELENFEYMYYRDSLAGKTSPEFAEGLTSYLKLKNKTIQDITTKKDNPKASEKLYNQLLKVYGLEVNTMSERMGVSTFVGGRKSTSPIESPYYTQETTKEIEILKSEKKQIDEQITTKENELIATIKGKSVFDNLDKQRYTIGELGTKVTPDEISYKIVEYEIANKVLQDIGERPTLRTSKDVSKITKAIEDRQSSDEFYQQLTNEQLLDANEFTKPVDERDYKILKDYLERNQDGFSIETKELKEAFNKIDKPVPKASFQSVDEIDEMIVATEINIKSNPKTSSANQLYLKKLKKLKEDIDEFENAPSEQLGTIEPNLKTSETADEILKVVQLQRQWDRNVKIKERADRWLTTNMGNVDDARNYLEIIKPVTSKTPIVFQKNLTPQESEYLKNLTLRAKYNDVQNIQSDNLIKLENNLENIKSEIKSNKNSIAYKAVALESNDILKDIVFEKLEYARKTGDKMDINELQRLQSSIRNTTAGELEIENRLAVATSPSTKKLLYSIKKELYEQKQKYVKEILDDPKRYENVKYQFVNKNDYDQDFVIKTDELIKTLESKKSKIENELIPYTKTSLKQARNVLSNVSEKIKKTDIKIKEKITLDEVDPIRAKKAGMSQQIKDIEAELSNLNNELEKTNKKIDNRERLLGALEKRETQSYVIPVGSIVNIPFNKMTSFEIEKFIDEVPNLLKGNTNEYFKQQTSSFYEVVESSTKSISGDPDKPFSKDISIVSQVDDTVKGNKETIREQAFAELSKNLKEYESDLSKIQTSVRTGNNLNPEKIKDITKNIDKEITSNKNNKSYLSGEKIKILNEVKQEFENAYNIASEAKQLYKRVKDKDTRFQNTLEPVQDNISKDTKFKDIIRTIRKNLTTDEPLFGLDKLPLTEKQLDVKIERLADRIKTRPYDSVYGRNIDVPKRTDYDKVDDDNNITKKTFTGTTSKTDTKSTSNFSDRDDSFNLIQPEQKSEVEMPKPSYDIRGINNMLSRNAVSTNDSLLFPVGTLAYPLSTPKTIIENVFPIQPPQPTTDNTTYLSSQQGSIATPNTFTESLSESINNTLRNAVIPDTQSILKTSTLTDLRLDQTPIQGTNIDRISIQALDVTPIQNVKLGSLELYKQPTPNQLPVFDTPVSTSEKLPPKTPFFPWIEIPYADRKRKKKERKTKSKKKKIYWDVPDQPFKPFNPKEYFTFRTEPRAVKRKEGRKNLD